MRFCVTSAGLRVGFLAAACVIAFVPAAATPAPPAPPPAPSGPAAGDSDAAAKHAKLTECLRESKSRKLVGAEKTAFLKECTSKP